MAGGEARLLPSAVVVGVGDELLYGHTVDTNGAWLSGALSALGFRVARRAVVGDVQEEIVAVLREALEWGEVVLVTGGLGPTPDDLTREAVARLLGVPLEVDPGLLEALSARFRARGYDELPANSRAMAEVPRGGIALPNPRGAAPGLVLTAGEGRTLILLPGVPREMESLFQVRVEPLLGERFGSRLQPVAHRVIHTAGIPESLLSLEVARLLPHGPAPVSLAFLPDLRGVRLRMTLREDRGHSSVADEALDRVEGALAAGLEAFRYDAPSGDLAEAVGAALLKAGATLAVAESCTGGLVAGRITALPGASRYFLGGVVAYENRIKAELLGVDSRVIEEVGAVSREVAEAMALGVALKLGARAGVGVTGIAGPGGGTEEKPVGTVWCAACLDGMVEARRERFSGDRGEVRERAAQAALLLLLRVLEGRRG